jgi:deoxyribodipyrimidine photolyase
MTVDKQTRSGTGGLYSIFTPFKKSIWQKFLDYQEVNISEPKKAFKISSTQLGVISQMKRHPELVSGSKSLSSESIIELFNKSRKIKVGEHILDLNELTH